MAEGGRVEEILDAAYVCFTRHGMRRTTMDDIARAAGMSRAAVYQYVRNKEDAFRRLVLRLTTETVAAARAAADRPGSPADRLAGVLSAKLDLSARIWRDSPAHAAELLGPDTRHGAAEIAASDAAMRDLVAAVLPASPARADLAEALLALVRGLELDLSDPGATHRRLRRTVEVVVAGLAARA